MVNRAELTKRIQATIEDLSEPLWFPSLTGDLVKSGWDDLKKTNGLEPSDYSTTRLLAPKFKGKVDRVYDALPIPIEFLPLELQQKYLTQGVGFFAPRELKEKGVINCISVAAEIIKSIPSLWLTITKLTISMHLIKSENDNCDVSFSEPNLPFSIFISIPNKRMPFDYLRVAESIVHEAMHLQLTLIDRVVPSTKNGSPVYFSPWRVEKRSAISVLHGLYVFVVIHQFFQGLVEIHGKKWSATAYAEDRIRTIQAQMSKLEYFRSCCALTTQGELLSATLICKLL
jgi:hypothetical protein